MSQRTEDRSQKTDAAPIRTHLLELAVRGGADLATALDTAARAELWLAGLLTCEAVLGQPLLLAHQPHPVGEKPPAEIPAAALVEARSGEDEAAKPPETGNAGPEPAFGHELLAAIALLGPEASNRDLADASGTNYSGLGWRLAKLQKSGKVRVTGDARRGDRRIELLAGGRAPKACEQAGHRKTLFPAPATRTANRPLRDVTDRVLDPGPVRGRTP